LPGLRGVRALFRFPSGAQLAMALPRSGRLRRGHDGAAILDTPERGMGVLFDSFRLAARRVQFPRHFGVAASAGMGSGTRQAHLAEVSDHSRSPESATGKGLSGLA